MQFILFFSSELKTYEQTLSSDFLVQVLIFFQEFPSYNIIVSFANHDTIPFLLRLKNELRSIGPRIVPSGTTNGDVCTSPKLPPI